MLKQSALVLALLAWGAAQAAGGLYKWVDEQGNVHYRDTPPPASGSSYQTLRKPPPPSQKPEDTMQQLREKTQTIDKAKEEEQQRKQSDQKIKDLEARRAESCRQAKHNLEVLLEKSGHAIGTDAEGKRLILDQEQREEEIARNRKYEQFYCDKSESAATSAPPAQTP